MTIKEEILEKIRGDSPLLPAELGELLKESDEQKIASYFCNKHSISTLFSGITTDDLALITSLSREKTLVLFNKGALQYLIEKDPSFLDPFQNLLNRIAPEKNITLTSIKNFDDFFRIFS